MSDHTTAKTARKMPTLRLLGSMIGFRPWLYLANFIVWVLFHNVGILSELVGREYFNLIEGKAPGWNIEMIILLTIAATLLRVGVYMLGSLIDGIHRFTMNSLLQRNLIRRIFRHPGAQTLSMPSGEGVSVLRAESETLVDAISWTIDTCGEIVALVVGIVILTSIDPWLTLTVYIPLLFVAFISQKLEKLFQDAREKAHDAGAKIGDRIGDIFASIQAVQVAGAEAPILAHLQELNQQRRRMVLREKLFSILFDASFYLNFTIITAVILWNAAAKLLAGTMTVGDLLLFINYLDLLTDGTLMIGATMVTFFQCGSSFRRLSELAQSADPFQIVEHTPEPPRGEVLQADPVQLPVVGALQQLRIEQLSFRYDEHQRGIDAVDLQLQAGSFNVITGRIGSGKTTLLRAILGLVAADSGCIYWNETRIDDAHDFFIPERSAYVPQLPMLLSDTIRNNLALGSPYSEAELLDALRAAAFQDDLQRMERGLDTEIGSRGTKLSGGQMQRVASARALLRQPQLLVLDDLSSALDVRTEEQLWQNLDNQRSTFLLVSHRRSAFRRADQIIVMENGRIADRGTWSELLERNETFRLLWDQTTVDEASGEAQNGG